MVPNIFVTTFVTPRRRDVTQVAKQMHRIDAGASRLRMVMLEVLAP